MGTPSLFQRHRDPDGSWKWKTQGDPVKYQTRLIRRGNNEAEVALLLSLSGRIPVEWLPPNIDDNYSVYELTLDGREPDPRFLNRREDLRAFEAEYENCRRRLTEAHPQMTVLDVFPAVPAPVAVACGRNLLPRIDPVLQIYNKESSGYVPAARVNDHDRQ